MEERLFPHLLFSSHTLILLPDVTIQRSFFNRNNLPLCLDMMVWWCSYTNRHSVFPYPGSFLAVGSREPWETTRALPGWDGDIMEGNKRAGRPCMITKAQTVFILLDIIFSYTAWFHIVWPSCKIPFIQVWNRKWRPRHLLPSWFVNVAFHYSTQ